MTFEQQLMTWAKKTNQTANQVVVRTCASLSKSIIEKTPVGWRNGGRARGNWIASLSAPSKTMLSKTDESGATAIAKANSTAADAPGNVFYLVNNLPYINMLEYGGYPTPVKAGTWRKDKGIYEVRSIGGYSIQAPHGMVGLTVREFRIRLKEAINEL